MRSFRAWRALVRAESRAGRREPARAWLVLALVAVPVAAMAGGSALFATARRTPDEARAAAMGDADLRLDESVTGARAAVLVPEAREIAPIDDATVRVHAPGVLATARGVAVEPGALDGAARGIVRVVEGRAPLATDEVAASHALLRELRVDVGARVEVDGRAASVVGVALDPERVSAPLVLRVLDPARDEPTRAWLARVDDAGAVAARLRGRGLGATARADLGGDDSFETAAVLVVGGFAFFEAALVIAAALAVGLRRRQREIGLLAACGATPAALGVAIAGSTVAIAVAGTALGLAVGLGAARALVPFLDGWNDRWNGDLALPVPLLAAAAAMGVATPLVAVLLPALGAIRLPVRVALAGRRPVAEGARAFLVLGLALLVAGVACVTIGARGSGADAGLAILFGSAVAVLGLGAASPALLAGLARVAAPLPLAWRLAARDAGRFRTRDGPVVTAVLAGSSVTLLVAVLGASVDAFLARHGRAGDTQFVLVFALVATLVTSVVVVVAATTLATVEAAGDARVLHAVGADPGTSRMHAGARAAWLALLGALLAVPGGLVPGAGLVGMANADLAFTVPWREIACVVVLQPAVAFALAYVLDRRDARALRTARA